MKYSTNLSLMVAVKNFKALQGMDLGYLRDPLYFIPLGLARPTVAAEDTCCRPHWPEYSS